MSVNAHDTVFVLALVAMVQTYRDTKSNTLSHRSQIRLQHHGVLHVTDLCTNTESAFLQLGLNQKLIMFTTLEGISDSQKQELVAGLATLLVGSAAEPELTAEKLQAVASASGNSLSPAMATLFASTVQEVKPYVMSPGGGGGGGGGAAAGGAGDAAAAPAKEEEKEEEEMDLGGGMDMFGGDAGGGGDY